jgi:hypothetical protein
VDHRIKGLPEAVESRLSAKLKKLDKLDNFKIGAFWLTLVLVLGTLGIGWSAFVTYTYKQLNAFREELKKSHTAVNDSIDKFEAQARAFKAEVTTTSDQEERIRQVLKKMDESLAQAQHTFTEFPTDYQRFTTYLNGVQSIKDAITQLETGLNISQSNLTLTLTLLGSNRTEFAASLTNLSYTNAALGAALLAFQTDQTNLALTLGALGSNRTEFAASVTNLSPAVGQLIQFIKDKLLPPSTNGPASRPNGRPAQASIETK